MPYDIAEQVLRATANAMTSSSSSMGEQSGQFRDYAATHAKVIGNAVEADAVGLVIAAAVGGIALSYLAISSQLSAEKNKRLSFDKERIAGIATFTLPKNTLDSDLYKEQRVIKDFIGLAKNADNSSWSTYLGIQSGALDSNKDVDFYSVLPFYRLSEQLEHPVASLDLLDQARKNIRLFFSSALPETMSDLDHEFQMETQVVEFFKSTFAQSDYLNDLAAPRFIMISLSNLLWNLQHPVDADGLPLNVNDCCDLCDQVDIYLNNLLLSNTLDIASLNNETNQLLSFVRRVKTHNNSLKMAFSYKQAHELNIEEIANSPHRALRMMDASVYKLIYKQHNPLTGKDTPDLKAAESMADQIGYLNELVMLEPGLLSCFVHLNIQSPRSEKLTQPAQNIMDILIIFCHLTRPEKEKLFTRLKLIHNDSALEFTHTLIKFDKKFIHPIKLITQRALKGKHFWKPDRAIVAANVASRLLPLITLVIEDFRILVNSPAELQVKAINQEAATNATYYKWDLPFLLQLDIRSADQLEYLQNLPKQQYRMTQMTQLLDNLNNLIQSHRGFLRLNKFQVFIQDCLGKIMAEYTNLVDSIKQASIKLPHDNIMLINLSAIIHPLNKQLESCVAAFAVASKQLQHALNIPGFTAQEKSEFEHQISAIHAQYGTLFGSDSGISDLTGTQNTPAGQIRDTIPSTLVAANSVLALRDLVQRCRNALSWQSQIGRKGALLDNLLADINQQPNFTPDQIKQVILRLVRVTASYRKTMFGQADYGHTRSAQALIAAIKDPALNKLLPLSNIICAERSDDIQRILWDLRQNSNWENSVDEIQVACAV